MKIIKWISSIFSRRKIEDDDLKVISDPNYHVDGLQTWRKRAFEAARNKLSLKNINTQLRTRFAQGLNIVLEKYDKLILNLKPRLDEAIKKLTIIQDGKESFIENEKEQLYTDRAHDINAIDSKVENVDREVEETDDRINDVEAEIDSRGIAKIRRSFFEKVVPSVIISIGIIGTDSPFTWEPIETLYDIPPIFAMLMGLALSCFIAMMGHLAGKFLTQKKKTRLAKVCIGIGVILCTVILVLRATLDDNLALTGTLLYLLFAISVIVSYVYNLNKFSHDLIVLAKELRAHRSRLLNAKSKLEKQRAKIVQEITAKAKKNYKTTLRAQENDVKNLREQLNNAETDRANVVKDFAEKEKQALAQIQDSYERGLRRGRKGMEGATTIVTLLMVFTFHTSFAQDYLFLPDKSMSGAKDQKISSQEVFDFLAETIGIDSVNYYGEEINVFVSVIGQQSIPEVTNHSLEPSGHWLISNRKKRIEEQREFLRGLRFSLTNFIDSDDNHQQTHFYRPFMHSLGYLDTTRITRIYCLSDLISESEVLDMAEDKYLKNPSLLYGEDYELLKAKLLQDVPLPDDLSHLEITLVFSVDMQKDELSLAASRFWSRFFGERKAVVKTKATL